MKKRIFGIFLACLLTAAVCPMACARNATALIDENFETGPGVFTSENAYLRMTKEQSASGCGHSLAVKMKEDYGGPRCSVELEQGMSYRISAWIKPIETPQVGKVSFVFRGKATEGEEMLYHTVAISGAELAVAGKWSYAESDFLFDGNGARTIGGTHNLKMSSEVIMQIVLGNGEKNEYYIDELCLRPVKTSTNLIRGGEFDSQKDLGEWKQDRCSAYIEEGGADGTPGCVYIQETAQYGQLRQNVPVKYNRTYSVSFWAKAADELYAGQSVKLYLDRNSVKTDSAVASYQELLAGQNCTLTTEWTHYEATYYYAIDTADASRPIMYLRIGDGKRNACIYLDGFEIRETACDDIILTGELNQNAAVGETVQLSFQTPSSRKNISYRYRIYRAINGNMALVTEGSCENNKASYTAAPEDKGAQLVFEILAYDSYGDCVGSLSKTTETVTGGNAARFELMSSEWDEEDNSIAVRVSFDMEFQEQESALACLALYSADNIICTSSVKNVTETGSVDLTCAIPSEAAYAKIFAWGGGLSPYTESRKIEKRVSQLNFYVDAQNGSDSNLGTASEPFATVERATEVACSVTDTDIDRINLIFREGVYTLTDTVTIGARSAAAPEIYYRSEQGGDVIFSGGRRVTGWTVHDAEREIYKAYVGSGVQSRQLYINDVRAERARSTGGLTDCTVDESGHTSIDTYLASFAKPQDLEMVYFKGWVNQRCAVDSIKESDGKVQIAMAQPTWERLRDGSSTAVDYPAYYENAYELLDEEGEWYLDSDSGYLYYKPRFFEQIHEAEIVLPMLETLFRVEGSSENELTQRIGFDGISFQNSTWLKPSVDKGLYISQNNYIRMEANRLSAAAVEVKNAREISFENCEFRKIGGIALKLWGTIQNCRVRGNEFCDIAGNAVALGEPNYTNKNIYLPDDYRYMIIDNKITDNYIHHIGMDYHSASAISAGFLKYTEINNNEIFAAPYSGIHVGFGWAEIDRSGMVGVRMNHNCITDVLTSKVYDGGAIYSVGPTGGTEENPNEVRSNYIRDVGNFYGAFYPDMGSSYWLYEQNVVDYTGVDTWVMPYRTETPRWFNAWHESIHHLTVRNNYSTTANAKFQAAESSYEEPTVRTDDTWPDAAKTIIEEAGISQAYRANFAEKLYKIKESVSVTATVGSRFVIDLGAKTTKDAAYDLSDCAIYYRVLTPDIISVTDTPLTGTALKEGTGELEVFVIEKGILRKCKVTIQIN